MPTKLEDYEVLDVIGKGSFGVCYKVRKKLTKEVLVWKSIDYGKMSEDQKQHLVYEVNLLRQLKHPNIVKYYDRIIHKETTTLYIIMEYCEGGDLATLINKCKRSNTFLEEGFIWQVLYQTSKALQACHSHFHPTRKVILHRDIKPANLFLDKDGNVKLGDFGLAKVLNSDFSFAKSVVGTPYYMSPEVVKGCPYNKKSDIWSMGCLIYELCSLIPPFTGSNIRQLLGKIKDGRFHRIPPHYSDDLQRIVVFMLTVEDDLRPSIEMLVHHPTVLMHLSEKTAQSQSFAKRLGAAGNELSDECSAELADECNGEMHPERAQYYKQKGNSVEDIQQEKAEMHNEIENKVSESVLREKLEAVKHKEAVLRLKELTLVEKERILERREKKILLLGKLVQEKLTRADVYLKQCRDTRSSYSGTLKSSHRAKSPLRDVSLDTSYSADPGDTSVLPTSTKLNPDVVTKPQFVQCKQEKRVHFEKLPEITQGKEKAREPFTKLQNVEQMPPLPSLDYAPKYSVHDLEKAVLDNYKKGVLSSAGTVLSHDIHDYNPRTLERLSERMSWNEKRCLWLETKRSAHNKALGKDKENIEYSLPTREVQDLVVKDTVNSKGKTRQDALPTTSKAAKVVGKLLHNLR